MTLELPDAETLLRSNDWSLDDYPRFATARRIEPTDPIEALQARTREAIETLDLEGLPSGSRIGVTAGSRGIADVGAVLTETVSVLADRGLEPFIIPAMGSHGGATAQGQRETLASLGITEEAMGCPIQSSMEVEQVGTDDLGRPVYLATDALDADGIVLVNRIKPHTDFSGPVESGLCKIGVVGLGKHRGAESFHNAGLAGEFADVLIDRARIVLEESPILGGIGLIEDATERATVIEGIPARRILDREPALLERAYEELPMLPVEELDLLIVDRIGKDISGTCLDTNVIGRYQFHGEEEPQVPRITRIYARSLTPASHGNGLGIGLADFARRDLIEAVDLEDMYINIATSGEPSRGKLPLILPDDRTALRLIPSTLGVSDLSEARVARIPSTLDPHRLVVSEPVAEELHGRSAVEVGPLTPLSLTGNELATDPYMPDQ